MRKIVLSCIFLSILDLLMFSSAKAANLDLNVQVFVCTEGKYLIRFTMKNEFTYDKHPTIGFKVMKGDEVIACERMSLTVPARHDGSEVHEVTLEAPCFQDDEVSLVYKIFPRVDRNKAGPWLRECP